MSNPNSTLLLDMLSYKRPEGSATQARFCQRFLEPVFGPPDVHGNYITTIGDDSRIAFMAHHDTVHRSDGMQATHTKKGIVRLSKKSKSNCLGADCTTGVWLILHMIANNIPGRYVIHAGEECGGIGATALNRDWNQRWIEETDFAISFDRFGTDSIITHQFERRTASDAFATSLSEILGMGHSADSGGSFTDSEVYSNTIPECTNLSVGYLGQHTAKETQDIIYAVELAAALVDADWSQLVVDRDPSVVEYEDWRGDDLNTKDRTMIHLVEDHPEEIAELLENLGYLDDDVAEYLGLGSIDQRIVTQ